MNIAIVSGVSVGLAQTNAVDGRQLWESLEVSEKFADWIQRRIEECQAVDSVDFLKIKKPNENNKIDYTLSLDTAKHIAMLERTEKGRKIRQYFIDVEKTSLAPRPVTNNPQLAALRDLIDNLVALDVAQQQQQKEIQQLRSEVRELPSKISGCAGFYTILAYANIRKVRVDAKQGSVLGKAATMLCNKEGIRVGKVSDSRYGEINTYPEEIISKVWDMFF
jgi:anti-repressor protein